jgi:hypothetical protein
VAIPLGITIVWTGTNAGIPADWERETLLDGIYPKGALFNVNPNKTGGTATHTHTSSAHAHLDSHSHTITIAGTSVGGVDTGPGAVISGKFHTHTVTCGAVSGGSLSSVTSTYSEISNNPPYYEVIFIKPQEIVSGVPDDGICFVDSSDTLDFTFCNGSNDTPDLRNKYLKGAPNPNDAGTTGGSYTNVHNLTHTHTVAVHDHIDATTSAPTTTGGENGTDSNKCSSATHTHTIDVATETSSITAAVAELTTVETVEPAYEKLVPVQNKTGNNVENVGMIGMWLGLLSDIPSGWQEVSNMRGKHLKCSNTTSEFLIGGGSNTHTHANQYHTHTASAVHTHTHGALSHVSTFSDSNHTGATPNKSNESHPTVTVANGTSVYADTATSADSSSNEPAYRTVNFIKLVNIISGSSFIFNML